MPFIYKHLKTVKNEKRHCDTYFIVIFGIYHHLYDNISNHGRFRFTVELETTGQHHYLRHHREYYHWIYKEKNMTLKADGYPHIYPIR